MAHAKKPLAVIPGAIRSDAFHFSLSLRSGGRSARVRFALDTGAFEMLLSQRTAAALGLPNQGAVRVYGVTGHAAAYRSRVHVRIGSRLYRKVRCVVLPSMQTDQLFGLRFFIDNRLSFLLDPRRGTLSVYA